MPALTARDRYRRIRAYARASKREDDARLAVVRGDRGAAWRNLPQLVDNASEAWSRLPDVARRAVLDPREG